MKMYKIPLFSFVATVLLLTGCSGVPSNLQAAERELYTINQEVGEKMVAFNEMVNQAGENPDFEAMWEKAKELTTELENKIESAERLNMPEITEVVRENATRALESTQRLADKISELALTARGLLQGEEVDQEQVDEILKSIKGYSVRLEQAKQEFEKLNNQLIDANL